MEATGGDGLGETKPDNATDSHKHQRDNCPDVDPHVFVEREILIEGLRELASFVSGGQRGAIPLQTLFVFRRTGPAIFPSIFIVIFPPLLNLDQRF